MERPIHLRQYSSICRIEENTDDAVIIPVWIRQSSLDGILAVISFLDGFSTSGKGDTSATFEVIMFYRTIRDCIEKAEKAARETKNEE